MKPTDLSVHVTNFLTRYLAGQRNLSPNTIKAYRDVFTLMLRFGRDGRGIAVERLSEVPASYIVSLSASFVLSDATTGRTLLTGNSAADASYDFSSQRFANVRALEDAESRAAKTIASDLRIRLAAYFATHR